MGLQSSLNKILKVYTEQQISGKYLINLSYNKINIINI